jgi:hypothetical protein
MAASISSSEAFAKRVEIAAMSVSNSTRCRSASCVMRRSLASMAMATRSEIELAKCSSSEDQFRSDPVCSKQPVVLPSRRIGASSIDITPYGSR